MKPAYSNYANSQYWLQWYQWHANLENTIRGLSSKERKKVVISALAKLTEPPRMFFESMYFEGGEMAKLQRDEWQRSERIYAMVFGAVTITFMAVVAFVVPEPKPFQLFIFRLICSLGAGAVGAFLPGSLTTSIGRPSLKVRAGGALALAVIVWFVNPPALAGGGH